MTTDARVEEAGYTVARRPNPDVARIARSFLNEHARAGIFDAMGLPEPSLHFVVDRWGGHLARAFAPSSDFDYDPPGILISPRAITAASRRYDVDLATTIESTLLHEYGHLWFRKGFGEPDEVVPSDEEEEIVEAFAHQAWRTGDWMAALDTMRRRAAAP
jgi:hypothetical protein